MDFFLHNFDTRKIPREKRHIVIVGSGIAGLATAIYLIQLGLSPTLVTIGRKRGSTVHAQGGIASAVAEGDTPDHHLEDTITAGDGLVDEKVAKVFVYEGIERVIDLARWGVEFARDNNGFFELAREGNHSRRRILHVGDTTGEAIQETLFRIVKGKGIEILEGYRMIEILTREEKVHGIIIEDIRTKERIFLNTPIVVLATGGASYLFKETTNPRGQDGYGIAAAFRAGAYLSDMEFVQFHPTVLYEENQPRFLISEAVRGEGAFLLNEKGERFMFKYHRLGELAPRDVVAKSIYFETQKSGIPYVYLDMRHLQKKGIDIPKRFPLIFTTLIKKGVDPRKEPVKVSPAAHYFIGGVKTDIFARSNIKGLYVAGEAASTWVHGADRLASNSLLEGMVFGAHAAYSIFLSLERTAWSIPEGDFNGEFEEKPFSREDFENLRTQLWEKAGIAREKKKLLELREQTKELLHEALHRRSGNDLMISANLIAFILTSSALEREESRGCHYRVDFPNKNPLFQFHSIFSLGKFEKNL